MKFELTQTFSCGIHGARNGRSCNSFQRWERSRTLLTSHCQQGGALNKLYVLVLFGHWDMEEELKCFAFLLCYAVFCCVTLQIHSVLQSWLHCSHKPLTSRFLPFFIWFIFETLQECDFSIICITLDCSWTVCYNIFYPEQIKWILHWLDINTIHTDSGKFISRKSSYLPVHLHCLSRLNSKSYDAEQGWRTVG